MLDKAHVKELNEGPLSKADKQGWPPGVRPIGEHELDGLLGVDQSGILYWDGKPVQSRHFNLTRGQKVWAVLVALALIAGGLGSFLQGFLTYHDWACREGLPTVPCHMGQIDDKEGQ
jgi:hypothetical protein